MDQRLVEHLTAIRRQIHQNPELGFRGTQTSALVAAELERLAVPCQSGIACTGVVGLIDKGPAPSIALRPDMDAPPIMEENGLAFGSKNKSVMHAYGNDIHTTMLLDAASLLSRRNLRAVLN